MPCSIVHSYEGDRCTNSNKCHRYSAFCLNTHSASMVPFQYDWNTRENLSIWGIRQICFVYVQYFVRKAGNTVKCAQLCLAKQKHKHTPMATWDSPLIPIYHKPYPLRVIRVLVVQIHRPYSTCDRDH